MDVFYDDAQHERGLLNVDLHDLVDMVIGVDNRLPQTFKEIENKFPAFLKLQKDEASQVRITRLLSDIRRSDDVAHVLVMKLLRTFQSLITCVESSQEALDVMCNPEPEPNEKKSVATEPMNSSGEEDKPSKTKKRKLDTSEKKVKADSAEKKARVKKQKPDIASIM